MERASARWPTLDDNDALKGAIDLAKDSLAEVKGQTEYQDEKATRLLTVTTFLSALSGVLFSRFEDAYPVDTITRQPLVGALFLGCSYGAFAAFVIASLSGALVSFHATRTRFKYPPYQTTEDQENDPESLLFYGGLIRSRPSAWIKGWVTARADGDPGDRPALRDDLQQRYLRHLVSETYLVAAKTADKLRYLEAAQSLLAIALEFLFFWLVLLALISTVVPSTKPPAHPVQMPLGPAPSSSQLPSPALPGAPVGNVTPSVATAPPTGRKDQLL
jgi:predicted component of type VI protein secretion system